MSEGIPFDIAEIGTAEDIAPMVIYLLSDAAQEVTGQVYTVNGPNIALWAQPREIRPTRAADGWTPEAVAERFDAEIGQDRMPMLDKVEEIAEAAARAKAASSPNY
jgi:hypothetical protein